MPEGVDWQIGRVMSSPRYAVPSPSTILDGWTLEELIDANLILDMWDEADRKAARPRSAPVRPRGR